MQPLQSTPSWSPPTRILGTRHFPAAGTSIFSSPLELSLSLKVCLLSYAFLAPTLLEMVCASGKRGN